MHIKNLKSSLVKALRDYFIWAHLNNNPNEKKHMELIAYANRGMIDAFNKESSTFTDAPVLSDGYSIFDHTFIKTRVHELYVRLDLKKFGKTYAEKTEQYLEVLDEHVILIKLITEIQNVRQKRKYNTSFSNNMIDEVVSQAMSGRYDSNPFIPIFLQFYQYEKKSFKEELKVFYSDLKSKVFELVDGVGHDYGDLFIMLSTMALEIYMLNTGKYWLNELFAIKKKWVELRKLGDNSAEHPFVFYTNCLTAGALKETVWLKEYIDNTVKFLPADARNDAACVANAELYLAKGNYDRSIKSLIPMDHKYYVFTYGSKTVLARNYYHLKEYDLLLDYLKTFTAYLKRRKEMNKESKKSTLSFVKHLKRLVKQKLKGEKFLPDTVEKLIKDGKMQHKFWTVEQYKLYTKT